MDDLTPSYEPDAGQVILEGRPAGPAGEAGLVPVAGVDLAFDRHDGHLVRVVADADDQGAARLLLDRLFGPQAARVLGQVVSRRAEPGAPYPHRFSPEPTLSAALSSLARLDAVRDTSPVPRRSPWWAAEATVLAEQAGLHDRARAEARRLHGIIAPHHACAPGLDVAAEVEELEKKDAAQRPGLNWALDPALVPAGLLRPGLSPHSDLLVRYDDGEGTVIVEATLAAGADNADADRCLVRLVDPAVRRVLAQSDCRVTGSRLHAELRLPWPLDELDEAWIEVVEGMGRPVRSAQARLIRRALRWADTALRADRAPAGLAPQASAADWAALAALAREQCRQDWAAAGDSGRASAQLTPADRASGPACLAEMLGY